MAVRDEIREQRAKLKGQGFKAHWDYFWEYYKIPTIAGIAVLIFICILAKDILNKKPYAIYAMLLNCGGTQTQTTLQDGFTEYAGIDTSKEDCVMDTMNSFDVANMDSGTVATGEKIVAFMAGSDLDAVVADVSSFYHYSGQGIFMDLRDILTDEELKAVEDDLFYIDMGYINYLESDAYTEYITTGRYDENNRYAVMAAAHDEYG